MTGPATAPFASREEFAAYLAERSNWGRFGEDEALGAPALIDDDKRRRAAALIRTGRRVSLSRPFPVTPGPANPRPAELVVDVNELPDGGAAVDFLGIRPHGFGATHLDALCHFWGERGMWGGRRPEAEVTADGSRWGGVEVWRDGLLTRGLVVDVPRLRGAPYVEIGHPVEAEELERALAVAGLEPEPGDALLVHGGREAFEAAHPDWQPYAEARPGLEASCLRFIREHDIAVLCWDMLDARPNTLGLDRTVHCAIHAFGVALVDNCRLTEAAAVAHELDRRACAVIVAPLDVPGGTGSPVNPIALF